MSGAYPCPCNRALELDVSRGAIIVTGNYCPGDGIVMHVMVKGEILCSPRVCYLFIAAVLCADFRGGNCTSVLTGDSL